MLQPTEPSGNKQNIAQEEERGEEEGRCIGQEEDAFRVTPGDGMVDTHTTTATTAAATAPFPPFPKAHRENNTTRNRPFSDYKEEMKWRTRGSLLTYQGRPNHRDACESHRNHRTT